MFSDHTHEIHKQAGHSLRLMDPRVIAKYCKSLHRGLEYHKVPQKCEELRKVSGRYMDNLA